ncbi:hypothetical protein LINGRAHAP2_LOCUS13062, partial [Linum grandiflorum]
QKPSLLAFRQRRPLAREQVCRRVIGIQRRRLLQDCPFSFTTTPPTSSMEFSRAPQRGGSLALAVCDLDALHDRLIKDEHF